MAETASRVALTDTAWAKVSTDGWVWAAIQNTGPDLVLWCRANAQPNISFTGYFILNHLDKDNVTELTGLNIYARAAHSATASVIVDGGV